MSDDTYHMSIPKIRNWIYGWTLNDAEFKMKIYELTEDAASYCYVYWLEVNKKFEGEEAKKYYNATFLFKLSNYMNKFYKNKYATKDETLFTTVHIDDVVLNKIEDESLNEDTKANIDVLNSILKLFIESAHDSQKDILKDVISSIIDIYNMDKHKKYKTKTLQIRFDAKKISDKHNIKTSKILNIWSWNKKRFIKEYPEIRDYLRTLDDSIVTEILKEPIIIKSFGGRYIERKERVARFLSNKINFKVEKIVYI